MSVATPPKWAIFDVGTARCRECGCFVTYDGIVRGYHAWRCSRCDRHLERAEVHVLVYVGHGSGDNSNVYHMQPSCDRIGSGPRTKTLTMLTDHWRPCKSCGPYETIQPDR